MAKRALEETHIADLDALLDKAADRFADKVDLSLERFQEKMEKRFDEHEKKMEEKMDKRCKELEDRMINMEKASASGGRGTAASNGLRREGQGGRLHPKQDRSQGVLQPRRGAEQGLDQA
jgi:hypothetical protein